MTTTREHLDMTDDVATLRRDGITAQKGAFRVALIDELQADIETAFAEARSREGGMIGRGPQRSYSEVNPEAIRAFADLVGHPWVQAVCASVLGPGWTVVDELQPIVPKHDIEGLVMGVDPEEQ